MAIFSEPTNADRAERINRILPIYKREMLGESGTPDDGTVSDLLADLRHYCDREDLDFAVLDRVAYVNYTEEKG